MKFFRTKYIRKKTKPLYFRQIVPNMVTSGNLLCGLFSLMFALQGLFTLSAWMIFFAVIFDGLDGKVARILGGRCGKEPLRSVRPLIDQHILALRVA